MTPPSYQFLPSLAARPIGSSARPACKNGLLSVQSHTRRQPFLHRQSGRTSARAFDRGHRPAVDRVSPGASASSFHHRSRCDPARSPACDLASARARRGFRSALAPDQKRVLAWFAARRSALPTRLIVHPRPRTIQPPPPNFRRLFCCRKDIAMPTTLFTANNPPTLWRVPTHSARSIRIPPKSRPPDAYCSSPANSGWRPTESCSARFAPQCEQAVDNVEALLSAAGMTTVNIGGGTLPRSGRMPAPEKKR